MIDVAGYDYNEVRTVPSGTLHNEWIALCWLLSSAKYAIENRIDMLQVIGVVEHVFERRSAELSSDVLVGFKFGEKILAVLPRLHGVALHQCIAISRLTPACVSASSTRCELCSPPSLSRFFFIVRGIDQQLLDHARQSHEAKSSVMVASGPIMRSTDECEMSRSCQSATFSIAGSA